MIRIKLLIFLIFSGLWFGCDKDDEMSGDPFFGDWEIVEATGIAAELNVGTIYTFKEDGTITISLSGLSNSGTYVKTATEISITLSGIDLIYRYALSDENLTMENVTSDQVFILKKL